MSDGLNRSSGGPLYLQIYAILRQRILDGQLVTGETLPPEPILCQNFGVARGTIRQALGELEATGYINRERGRGTFVVWDHTTTKPSNVVGGQIGFVVPYVRDSYVTTILLGVESAASSQGLSVTFKHVDNSVAKQAEVLQELIAQNLLGIVIYPVDSIHVAPLDQLIRSNPPIVLVDRYLRDVPSDYVISDHFGGALKITQHLIRLGHKRIGFVTWTDPAVSLEHRMTGYQQALAEACIPVDPARILEVEGYPTIDRRPLKEYFARRDVTAVFAANDQIALAIYEFARQTGMRIPEDLALVGFDNLDVTAHLDVPLTTVGQPAFEIGQQAVAVLLRRIHGDITGWQQIILPTQLVVRESCGGGVRSLHRN